AGAVLLPAPPLAAAAQQALRDHPEVAELTGRAPGPADDPPVHDERPTHARADREHDHVAHTAAGTEAELRPPRGVRVVLDDHGDAVPDELLLALPQRVLSPGDVRGEYHRGAVDVDEARCRHPDRCDLPGWPRPHELAAELGHR